MNEVPLDLIDCTSRALIPHTATAYRQLDYVGLSYVWGESVSTTRPDHISFPFTMPGNCPRTIDDVMLVVCELGLRYLWVDM
jgi:hypothetical protein